jgi:hypothetical protein
LALEITASLGASFLVRGNNDRCPFFMFTLPSLYLITTSGTLPETLLGAGGSLHPYHITATFGARHGARHTFGLLFLPSPLGADLLIGDVNLGHLLV